VQHHQVQLNTVTTKPVMAGEWKADAESNTNSSDIITNNSFCSI
jgi:hypothetical protein